MRSLIDMASRAMSAASSTMRRGPGGRLGHAGVGVAPEAEVIHDLFGLTLLAGLLDRRRRQVRERRQEERARARFERDHHRLLRRERRKEPGVLERPAEAETGLPVGGRRVDPGAEDRHVARRGEEAANGVHEGGLARAVGADEPDDLAGVDRDRDVVGGDEAAEADGHLPGLEARCRSRWLLRPG